MAFSAACPRDRYLNVATRSCDYCPSQCTADSVSPEAMSPFWQTKCAELHLAGDCYRQASATTTAAATTAAAATARPSEVAATSESPLLDITATVLASVLVPALLCVVAAVTIAYCCLRRLRQQRQHRKRAELVEVAGEANATEPMIGGKQQIAGQIAAVPSAASIESQPEKPLPVIGPGMMLPLMPSAPDAVPGVSVTSNPEHIVIDDPV